MIQENLSITGKQVATFGGGCFWCMEAVFNELNGVEKVVSGYSGGSVADPTYEQVCTGRTEHAEVVQITFDPKIISYKEILQIFFTMHDPTTLNRQGNDVGTQYRSVIFYHNNEQRLMALQVIEEMNLARIYDQPIVTRVEPFKAFYKAEDYHQEYFKKNPTLPYCRVVIAPKVAKLRTHYLQKLKKG
jgi:peptide-methionine (S)-S-oxide reductase